MESCSGGEEQDRTTLRIAFASNANRIRYFRRPLGKLPTLVFANGRDGIVDGVAQFAGGHQGEGLARLVDGLIEETPLDRVFDELRDCSSLAPLCAEMRAQRKIGILRPDDC